MGFVKTPSNQQALKPGEFGVSLQTSLGHFPFAANTGNLRGTSTITAILEADAGGTLHLPLPAELCHWKIKVEAKLEAAPRPPPDEETGSLKGFGAQRGRIRMAPDFDEPLEDFKDYMG